MIASSLLLVLVDEVNFTSGIGGDLFGSNNDCMRAQIVTFLWRLYVGK